MSKKGAARSKYALLEHSSKRTCDVAKTITVGRENTDLIFPALISLSRMHFQIVIDDEGAWIEDLGSSNGTKLNQIKLVPNSRQRLSNGDSILAGKAVFTFQVRPSIKKLVENSDIEIIRPAVNPVPVHQSAPLAPEISIMHGPAKRRRDDGPDFVFSSTSSEQPTGRKSMRRGLFTRHWTTIVLAIALSGLAYTELQEIWTSAYHSPHSARDLTLRYAFSMGLMYLFMILVQFVLTATIARRWFLAIPSVLLSLFFGSIVGDKLDQISEYRKADSENKLAAIRAGRLPANRK